MIGMHFAAFLTLLILSFIAALILHYAIGYRFLNGGDGFLWKWVVGWIGAWLGSPVLGFWFGGFKIADVYIIPAILGGFIGSFLITAVCKAAAKAFGSISSISQPKPI